MAPYDAERRRSLGLALFLQSGRNAARIELFYIYAEELYIYIRIYGLFPIRVYEIYGLFTIRIYGIYRLRSCERSSTRLNREISSSRHNGCLITEAFD